MTKFERSSSQSKFLSVSTAVTVMISCTKLNKTDRINKEKVIEKLKTPPFHVHDAFNTHLAKMQNKDY